MKIEVENYELSRQKIPESGQCIIGHQKNEEIVVYQAYKPSIAAFAVQNQYLGGSEYSYQRMSWIKPNFLWMMYRCGWAEKENQERVLALWINKKVLEDILDNAAFSSFSPKHYTNYDDWSNDLRSKEVRLQWDPDHDPFGNKVSRRAIQLGLKGKILEDFGKNKINLIEDITIFVKEQKQHIDNNQLSSLSIPIERVWSLENIALQQRIGIDIYENNNAI